MYIFFLTFFSHLPSTLLLCISRGHKCLYVCTYRSYFYLLFLPFIILRVCVYMCIRINISLAGSRPLIVLSLDISHSATLFLPRPSARVVNQNTPLSRVPIFSFDLLERALILFCLSLLLRPNT